MGSDIGCLTHSGRRQGESLCRPTLSCLSGRALYLPGDFLRDNREGCLSLIAIRARLDIDCLNHSGCRQGKNLSRLIPSNLSGEPSFLEDSLRDSHVSCLSLIPFRVGPDIGCLTYSGCRQGENLYRMTPSNLTMRAPSFRGLPKR